MLKLLFISGKNWILSLAELTNYFSSHNIRYRIEYFSREFFVIEFANNFEYEKIVELGGTLKIGEIKTTIPNEVVKEAFLSKNKKARKKIVEQIVVSNIIQKMMKKNEKTLFGVSIYFTDNSFSHFSGQIQRFIGSTIKKELDKNGINSKFMGYTKDRKAQLSNVEILKKNLIENQAEILFCIGKKEAWIASTVSIHNPFEFQKRDIYKPNQRTIFGMPPRLARIMVNLSGCNQKKTLLDAFCGVGTILQEALLEKAIVIGVDINSWCVKAAEENLEWLSREYNLSDADYRVIQGNVDKLTEKIGVESVDCIVSEPDLGPALKDLPTVPYAEKIIEKLKPTFYRFIEEAYRVLRPDGRLVLVTPYIRTRSKQAVTMSIDEKISMCGFQIVYSFSREMFYEELDVGRLVNTASLIETDERHKIGRQIHILQKIG